ERGRLGDRAGEGDDLRVAVVEEALSTSGQDGDVAALPVGHQEVWDAIAVDVPNARSDDPKLVRPEAGAGGGGPVALDVVAPEEDGDVVGAAVGDEHVGDPVPVEVLDGQPDRVGAHRIIALHPAPGLRVEA